MSLLFSRDPFAISCQRLTGADVGVKGLVTVQVELVHCVAVFVDLAGKAQSGLDALLGQIEGEFSVIYYKPADMSYDGEHRHSFSLLHLFTSLEVLSSAKIRRSRKVRAPALISFPNTSEHPILL